VCYLLNHLKSIQPKAKNEDDKILHGDVNYSLQPFKSFSSLSKGVIVKNAMPDRDRYSNSAIIHGKYNILPNPCEFSRCHTTTHATNTRQPPGDDHFPVGSLVAKTSPQFPCATTTIQIAIQTYKRRLYSSTRNVRKCYAKCVHFF
jgi:hypothetical protein